MRVAAVLLLVLASAWLIQGQNNTETAGGVMEVCPAHCIAAPLDESDDEETSDSNLYAYICIPVSFVLSIAGALVPLLTDRIFPRLKFTEWTIFRFLVGLAGGIVVSVALTHSFPDGSEDLDGAVEDGKMPDYAWAGFFALIGLLATFTIEVLVALYLVLSARLYQIYKRRRRQAKDTSSDSSGDVEKEEMEEVKDEPPTHSGHAHGKMGDEKTVLTATSALTVYIADSLVLLFGLTFHSFFVGVNQGLHGDDVAFFIAVVAHQFFEGLALGVKNCMVKFPFSLPVIIFFDLIFAISTPVGIGVGLGIKASVGHSSTYEIISGVSNSLSAGILVWVGSIHLIHEELGKSEGSLRALVAVYLGVLLGAAIMACIAIVA